jgi:hypothetical protein
MHMEVVAVMNSMCTLYFKQIFQVINLKIFKTFNAQEIKILRNWDNVTNQFRH